MKMIRAHSKILRILYSNIKILIGAVYYSIKNIKTHSIILEIFHIKYKNNNWSSELFYKNYGPFCSSKNISLNIELLITTV